MPSLFRLAVLISGNGSNLQAIIDAIHQGLPAQISIVISNQADAYGLTRATNAHIPTAVVKSSSDRRFDEQQMMTILDQHQPDLIILAGFMRILTPYFIQHYQDKILNIHPSLLPKYPGLDTHQQVITNHDSHHGCTIHLVTQDLDAGPIIAQQSLSVTANDTPETLKTRVQQLEHQLYPAIIELFATHQLNIHDGQPYLNDKPLTTNPVIQS